ncbi:MAG: Gfo/Idh/MocA family oxidoreductase [Legionellaceae bacterium]|nr:Gfo/Idh/MocA family oxidoreductase [Legionellaceae bacterium]
MILSCGVIGVGYLGRFHAQKYKTLPEANLVAVCDINPDLAQSVAHELDVDAYTNYHDLIGKVDAVSIAATTKQHYDIAHFFLSHGIHVLLEKPMTETLEQANTLISLAKKHQCLLQIGHLERFNAARLALDSHLHKPLFIESQRLAPFNPRGSDVNVILDLMIHDIDLILTMVQSPIIHIDAQGAPVLTSAIDIANARIHFKNHCVANVSASRISFKKERKMRIFQRDSYISIDYQNQQLAVFNKGEGEMFPGIPDIIQHQSSFEPVDALYEEIKSFVYAVQHKSTPLVTGEEGRDVLAVAETISELIHKHIALRDDFN